jgi:hypothetical protein
MPRVDVGHPGEDATMTIYKARKHSIRGIADQTGRSYTEISRLFDAFDRVVEAEPRLSSNGMGLSQGNAATLDERRAQFDDHRRSLRNSAPMVVRVYLWLDANIGKIKTPSRGSYGMKHVVENSLGEYVSNGELIAAALMAGYSMRDGGGLNPRFGMRKRDVDAAIQAAASRR